MTLDPSLRAKDLMNDRLVSVREEDRVDDVLDTFVRERIHSAPVLDGSGALVGMITQTDVLFGMMTRSDERESDRRLRVREVMTSPAVSTVEETSLEDLCRMMSQMRIHRIPVIRDKQVVGIVSSLDVCGLVGGQPPRHED